MIFDETAIEAAARAMQEACENPTSKKCEKCGGSGYEHFMFEDGPSPDWCSVCGGNGYDFDDNEPLKAALAAAEASLRERGVVKVNTKEVWKDGIEIDEPISVTITIIRTSPSEEK